jgi:hypothetical protein
MGALCSTLVSSDSYLVSTPTNTISFYDILAHEHGFNAFYAFLEAHVHVTNESGSSYSDDLSCLVALWHHTNGSIAGCPFWIFDLGVETLWNQEANHNIIRDNHFNLLPWHGLVDALPMSVYSVCQSMDNHSTSTSDFLLTLQFSFARSIIREFFKQNSTIYTDSDTDDEEKGSDYDDDKFNNDDEQMIRIPAHLRANILNRWQSLVDWRHCHCDEGNNNNNNENKNNNNRMVDLAALDDAEDTFIYLDFCDTAGEISEQGERSITDSNHHNNNSSIGHCDGDDPDSKNLNLNLDLSAGEIIYASEDDDDSNTHSHGIPVPNDNDNDNQNKNNSNEEEEEVQEVVQEAEQQQQPHNHPQPEYIEIAADDDKGMASVSSLALSEKALMSPFTPFTPFTPFSSGILNLSTLTNSTTITITNTSTMTSTNIITNSNNSTLIDLTPNTTTNTNSNCTASFSPLSPFLADSSHHIKKKFCVPSNSNTRASSTLSHVNKVNKVSDGESDSDSDSDSLQKPQLQLQLQTQIVALTSTKAHTQTQPSASASASPLKLCLGDCKSAPLAIKSTPCRPRKPRCSDSTDFFDSDLNSNSNSNSNSTTRTKKITNTSNNNNNHTRATSIPMIASDSEFEERLLSLFDDVIPLLMQRLNDVFYDEFQNIVVHAMQKQKRQSSIM